MMASLNWPSFVKGDLLCGNRPGTRIADALIQRYTLAPIQKFASLKRCLRQYSAGAKGLTAPLLTTINSGQIPNSFFRGSSGNTTIPQAYINYIFFDEQFKYAGGGASRVGSSGVVKDHWYVDATQLQNLIVPKNGYIFVYVSNESNLDVFFDNLQVIHKPEPILEETHYYPFGLTMEGISSKAAGKLENR